MAAPVMRNDSIPVPDEVEHLGVPVIGAQWPAMMEDDGLRVLGAPVLVEYRHAVLRGHRAHPSLLRSGAHAPTSAIRDRLPSLGRSSINSARRRRAWQSRSESRIVPACTYLLPVGCLATG